MFAVTWDPVDEEVTLGQKWFQGSMDNEMDLVERGCDLLLYTEGP